MGKNATTILWEAQATWRALEDEMAHEETERPRSHKAPGTWVKKRQGILQPGQHLHAPIPDPWYLEQNLNAVLNYHVLG